MKVVVGFVARLLFALVFILIVAALGDVRSSQPLKVAVTILAALGYMGLMIRIDYGLRPVHRRLSDHRTETLLAVRPSGRVLPSGDRLSDRQTDALLRAWEDFDLRRNRPEPPRTPGGRGVMWDEWLDGDHTPSLPTRQKNPRGRARG
jgi:hypothetical protein